MNKYNWSSIQWDKEQDVAIARKLNLMDEHGMMVMKRNRPVHPTREAVRQQRMKVYFRALNACLSLPEMEGEGEARAIITYVIPLMYITKELSNTLHGLPLMEGSPLKEALQVAYNIRWSTEWHAHEGTIRQEIKGLNTEEMTPQGIAKAVKCGVSYVKVVLKEEGLPHVSTVCSREKYNWSKLFKYGEDGKVLAGEWLNMTQKEVAKVLRVKNVQVITQYYKRNGIRKEDFVKASTE